MNMQTSFDLTGAARGGTAMKWSAEVKIAGPVGSMGQRVLQPIVNQQVGQVLNALEKQGREAAADAGRARAGIHLGLPRRRAAMPIRTGLRTRRRTTS